MTRPELADDSYAHFRIMEGEGGPRIYSFGSCRYCTHTTSRHDHPTDLKYLVEEAMEHARRHHPDEVKYEEDHR